MALEDIEAAISLYGENDKYLYNRGLVQVDMNRLSEAIASFDAAVALNPDDPDYLADRGRAKLLLGLQQHDQASLSGAVSDTAEAVRLAEGLDTGGTTGDGLKTQETPLGQQSGQGMHRYFLLHGNALQQSGRLRDAEREYSKAIDTGLDDGKSWANRAVVRAELGDEDGARADLGHLAEIHPEVFDELGRRLNSAPAPGLSHKRGAGRVDGSKSEERR